MKIMPLLKKEITKTMILEFSDKLIKKLINKFKEETNEDVDVILSYINDFKKFRESFSPNERDIEKYSYQELKNKIDPKRLKSSITKYYKHFKKTTNRVPNTDIIKAVRKFLEIKKFIDPRHSDITKINYLDLIGFLEKNFEKVMIKVLTEKLSSETTMTKDQINYYITEYFNILNDIPLDSKLVINMTGDEFEHFIDGLSKTSDIKTNSKDIKNIELVYDKDNLTIFAPKTKNECILLRNGRSWCTSRDGSSNLYYNYRLNNNLTLYYVINEDLPYSDVNFASVILVQTDGKVRLADGTNSGKYSGHSPISWDEIYTKIPKLRGLEKLFVPKPLTQDEKNTIGKVRGANVGQNPMKYFDGNEKLVELWLEINSPTLSDEQYSNVPDDIKKKYISLGFNLSQGMIENSSSKVIEFYVVRKIDLIKNKKLSQLDDSDIALLRLPKLDKVREELKKSSVKNFLGDDKILDINGLTKSDAGKYIALFGLDELIENLPEDLQEFKLRNDKQSTFIIKIPDSIGKFKELKMLLLDNCVDSVPKSVCSLHKLRFLSLMNNDKLKEIPECIENLENLFFLNLRGSNNINLPETITSRGYDMGEGYWDLSGLN